MSAGVAYRLGPVQAEIDVRYHHSAGQYTLYQGTSPMIVQSRNPDGSTTTSTALFPPVQYSTRQVVNVATGGNYGVGRLTFHAGFFASTVVPGTFGVGSVTGLEWRALTLLYALAYRL